MSLVRACFWWAQLEPCCWLSLHHPNCHCMRHSSTSALIDYTQVKASMFLMHRQPLPIWLGFLTEVYSVAWWWKTTSHGLLTLLPSVRLIIWDLRPYSVPIGVPPQWWNFFRLHTVLLFQSDQAAMCIEWWPLKLACAMVSAFQTICSVTVVQLYHKCHSVIDWALRYSWTFPTIHVPYHLQAYGFIEHWDSLLKNPCKKIWLPTPLPVYTQWGSLVTECSYPQAGFISSWLFPGLWLRQKSWEIFCIPILKIQDFIPTIPGYYFFPNGNPGCCSCLWVTAQAMRA